MVYNNNIVLWGPPLIDRQPHLVFLHGCVVDQADVIVDVEAEQRTWETNADQSLLSTHRADPPEPTHKEQTLLNPHTHQTLLSTHADHQASV